MINMRELQDLLLNAALYWSLQQLSVPYDVAAAVRRYKESGYLQAAGPMARLFMREVETATFHVVPFLKWKKDQAEQGHTPPLAAAVEQFLQR